MNKETVVIAFHGGSYGTYLEWCLTTLVNGIDIIDPFNANGDSHKFTGNRLINMQRFREYVSSNLQHKFARIHPKKSSNENINLNLIEIASKVSHLIYLYPGQHNVLLTVNNYFYKPRDNWFDYFFNQQIDSNKLYMNWPVDLKTPIDQLPTWVLREFLSFYMMPSWFDQVAWQHPIEYNVQNTTVITVDELLFDFVNTLLKIKKYCNLDYKISPEHLLPTHIKNLELQKYLNHDHVCNAIVESIKNNTSISWPVLSLPSEAWIQWTLRELGYEIKCHGLDVFPTDSDSLRDILYVSSRSQ
jgi:hypothetical protein